MRKKECIIGSTIGEERGRRESEWGLIFDVLIEPDTVDPR